MARCRRVVFLVVACVGCAFGQKKDFSAIDRLVSQAVEQHQIPGAVVEIGHNGHVVFRKAYGERSLEPTREPMTLDTIFDMASLTKPLMTATAVMQLCQQGKLSFNDPVSKYLPEFGANGKRDITIRQLLTHYSGLPPDLSLEQPWEGKAEAFRQAFAIEPATPAGMRFVYSDINFITLGALVEKLSGMTEDEYVLKNIIRPLGLKHTRYLPPVEWRDRIAPTQYEHGVMLRGVVHDPTARRMGGVAGHAGLFSTGDDVAIYAQNLLDRLAGRPSKFPVSRGILEKMVTPEQPATGTALRGFGWDIESPYSSNRGEIFPVGSFGHTGFTGTSLWIDPVSDSYVIVLTNAVHPDGGKSTVALRRQIADAAAAAIGVVPDWGKLSARLTGYNESLSGMRRWPSRNAEVKTGIDVLEGDNFAELHALAKKHDGHLRIGLLTNQTGVDAAGRRTIDILAHADGIELKALFSPEHGIRGAQDTTDISNTTDPQTGLPVISLYGATDAQRRPPLDTMRSLDAVVIDLQDAGVRFYTYESVMGYFLEAASKTGTDIIVLDRPNPINGAFVQGPLSDEGEESYVHYMALPARHGMTMGELARYFNRERELNAPLTVVKMQGWQRGDWYDSTGLAWVNPSPNLRDLEEATLYPGLGLVETTNISVGRGTDTPFEIFGAPWIDGRKLAQYLNHRFLPGVRFVPVDFTPQKPYPYAGEVCHGVRVMLLDRNILDAPELGIEVAAALHRLYSQDYKLERINTLLANKHVLKELMSGIDPSRIAEDWRASLEQFEAKRKMALLY
ncbi:exo-beta-N-acetylmuramidase NamZ domain-containing protein [Alloacidobacterium sp.]|uniref:exo-beta-N-acetylmuramidase NamZ domain-containing protein n=1 Tax=Alloacidobacterium sp. TaxID=2951999 RepID=UPI002D5C0605|nr:exo-beta-N-acetylmuramidase NamZ domain-containing protein [Alloacidobacterium sp.]HYK34474.1 exo-beta-N-acetylmuramidase NamZ domain-containing protein [Alloacidobacterium sp.]